QLVVEYPEAGRRGVARRVDVRHQNRVAWCAVGFPQLEAGAVVGREIQLVVEYREAGRRGIAREVDVLHLHRAQRRAVALPQLEAARAVVGREIQGVVEHGESRWRGTRHLDTSNGTCARGDVLHLHRAPGDIGLPQLAAADVVGREVQRVAEDGQFTRGGNCGRHPHRAAWRAVAFPQLGAGAVV